MGLERAYHGPKIPLGRTGDPAMQSMPPVQRARSHGPGFALTATLALMALALVAILGLLALAGNETGRKAGVRARAQAEANARLALAVALGQLQRDLGPDQRVSATAELLETSGRPLAAPHWTGVWPTRHSDGRSFWQRDAGDGGLRDRRFSEPGWDRGETVLNWLVSGNESQRPAPLFKPDLGVGEAPAIPLVGAGSLGPSPAPTDAIAAPRVRLDNRSQAGHYAWWVGDLGVKANLATPDAFEGSPATLAGAKSGGFNRLLTAQQSDASLMSPEPGRPPVQLAAAAKRKLANERSLPLAAPQAGARWQPRLFHHATVHSRGVLANPRDGGLKRNLSAYLDGKGPVAGRPGHPGINDTDRLVGFRNEAAARAAGLRWQNQRLRDVAPRFGILRSWAQAGAPHGPAEIDALAAKTLDSPPHNAGTEEAFSTANLAPVAIGNNDRANLLPILVEGSLYTNLSWHDTTPTPEFPVPVRPYQLRIHLFPRVVLWNPYNTDLTLDRTLLMMQGNGRQEMHTTNIYPDRPGLRSQSQWIWFEGGRSTNFAPVDNSYLKSIGYNDPYIGCFYFSLPRTTFGPGECLVFSAAGTAEYERPLPSSNKPYSLEKNELTCELPPDPSRNYYISNNEVGGGMSYVPETYWFAPTTGWNSQMVNRKGIENQADDYRVVLKHLGTESGVTFERFDSLPQLAVVSASLQYGAGREPRIAWASQERMPIEKSDALRPLLTHKPNVRTREGIRLRWHDEHLSNLLNSGGLGETPHFEEALLANWNPRASFAARSPWDNIAGSLPVTGSAGGPWFFGAYTRDLYDETVSWDTQMPVYRRGRYHGNPFGPPQEGADRHILFEVPRTGTGIVSLGQLQHAKLSEFVWHPSYAVGQSLADPRLGAEGPRGLLSTMPPAAPAERPVGGFHPDLIGWSNDIERSIERETWARHGRILFQDLPDANNLVYDLSYEVNHSLWDEFFLAAGDRGAMAAFLADPLRRPLPNGRLRLAGTSRPGAAELADFHLAARHFLVDGAFNVNSTSVDAWKALLGATRGLGLGDHGRAAFPRVLEPAGGEWRGTGDQDTLWSGFRTLGDQEIDRLAREIVRQVKLRGPFLSLADFVNRRLATGPTGTSGPLQAAIEAAGLNQHLRASHPLDNTKPLPDYSHPDNLRDATRLEQTLKPDSKAWGAPVYLTQGDLLQSLGPVLAARSDTFVVRAYGDCTDANGRVLARAWCEAVVQRLPEPLDPDQSGLDPKNAGTPADFGRRFIITAFQWLAPEEV
jgi:hypothetical protein